MSYLKGGVEYLDEQEKKVYDAIVYLNGKGRTTNNSQVAWASQLSRTTTSSVTAGLRRRGFITDTGKGSAYHWRVTEKPVLTEGT